ncbi:formate/nitrite transporter family protein [Aestuariivita sp.]|jgi:formate/nitrite transporter FocA (FNT family)|uniref:formate/nitrite transporter family protein n=1 Tax=Aestuariivita sp. TaxID=1872407 RepID=UPI002171448F|nr:formate/nitrite transporter family protein [Aestuariivita sp.]MCE8008598.1 formate/nitrite transporter family protein [Aestuariivita sp.]
MNERQAVHEATRLNSKLIYEVIRRDGEEELERPANSLIWSGVAAGILISFSVLGEAILRTYLPDAPWRYLVENLGYSFGFLLVILGRMQLFTENTITTVLPLVAERSTRCFLSVMRLWGIVLTANIFGAAVAAAFMAFSGAFEPDLIGVIADLSAHATGFPPSEAFLRAIPAGILVASIVWMMPGQNGNEVLLIVLFTWLIAAGDFTHIIAGSVEMWFLLLQGDLGLGSAALDFFLPVLAGNVVGGTAVFTLLAWGQVKAEVEETEADTHP